jgi:hypothetical protein
MSEYTAAQLLVDGVQARARRRAKTGDPRADRAAGQVIEADPETGLPRIKPDVKAKADAIVAAQLARNAEASR